MKAKVTGDDVARLIGHVKRQVVPGRECQSWKLRHLITIDRWSAESSLNAERRDELEGVSAPSFLAYVGQSRDPNSSSLRSSE
jgi:hypothetical protein